MGREQAITLRGIRAIEDAGGLSGFACEVLAEAKRHAARASRSPATLAMPTAVRLHLESALYAVINRRIQPDLERGIRERAGFAMIRATSSDQAEALVAEAMADGRAWVREVVFLVAAAIAPRIEEVRDQLIAEAAPTAQPGTQPDPRNTP